MWLSRDSEFQHHELTKLLLNKTEIVAPESKIKRSENMDGMEWMEWNEKRKCFNEGFSEQKEIVWIEEKFNKHIVSLLFWLSLVFVLSNLKIWIKWIFLITFPFSYCFRYYIQILEQIFMNFIILSFTGRSQMTSPYWGGGGVHKNVKEVTFYMRSWLVLDIFEWRGGGGVSKIP